MRSGINDFIDKISNIKWDTKFFLKLFSDKDFRSNIESNKKLKNIHKGKRCFIVGNGPSLNKLDLRKITNEITFTVNNIMMNRSMYEILNTNYHVLIDPLYFGLDPNIKEDFSKIALLKSIAHHNSKTTCITSYEGRKSFYSYGLNNHLDLIFIYQHKYLTRSFSGKIDFCKNIPTTQNVIQPAILAAIYMGFTEIYLIGCDMTSIFLTFEANENGEKEISKDFHAYKYTESEMKTMLKDSSTHDNEYMLYDYAKAFTIFKRIREYALKNNIKILNATQGGGLDVFERVKYDSLFIDDNNI